MSIAQATQTQSVRLIIRERDYSMRDLQALLGSIEKFLVAMSFDEHLIRVINEEADLAQRETSQRGESARPRVWSLRRLSPNVRRKMQPKGDRPPRVSSDILRMNMTVAADNSRVVRLRLASPLEILLAVTTLSGAGFALFNRVLAARDRLAKSNTAWAEAGARISQSQLQVAIMNDLIREWNELGLSNQAKQSGDIHYIAQQAAAVLAVTEKLEVAQ